MVVLVLIVVVVVVVVVVVAQEVSLFKAAPLATPKCQSELLNIIFLRCGKCV